MASMETLNKNKFGLDTKINKNFDYLALNIISTNEKLVSITSLDINEGKTFVSNHLVTSLTKLNKKVCLIKINDQDRNENLALLNNHFESNVSLEKVINHLEDNDTIYFDYNDDVVLLDVFPSVIDKLSEIYDYVILDGLAINDGYKALSILKLSQLVYLIIEEYKNSKEDYQKLLKLLNQNQIELAGVILNKVTDKESLYFK